VCCAGARSGHDGVSVVSQWLRLQPLYLSASVSQTPRAGTRAKDVDFLIVNCSLFCPTPSLCSSVAQVRRGCPFPRPHPPTFLATPVDGMNSPLACSCGAALRHASRRVLIQSWRHGLFGWAHLYRPCPPAAAGTPQCRPPPPLSPLAKPRHSFCMAPSAPPSLAEPPWQPGAGYFLRGDFAAALHWPEALHVAAGVRAAAFLWLL